MTELHPLARAVSHPSPAKGGLPQWRVITGVTLAPVAFSLQVIASYVVAAERCGAGSNPDIWLVAINLVALAAVVAGLAVAVVNFRATRSEKPGGHQAVQEIGEGRTRFLAYCGLCASAIFGLAVMVQFTSILTLSTCLGIASHI
ncbi:hypothetical protein QH494_18585 [Sphingomonas sp. AR_OL41]|uniref:hypothetical protein n=1 Tax=Sphingomonas sp. AR_OL41 TaxID=3042729 RepID=UPI00248035E0|nr:hypothetical protein [Sphingomonas sp. AR_OL41]MDH7974201.1 hypothetical protein [Sphingomonas sp. AR_OL41]